MNKFNNPRLTNTTVSGTGVKHPMRPHVILGDPENGFIRGDLLDANAVIKLIKNAAKAIGALEELEQSNWIDDDATTEEQDGVLQPGEVGFVALDGERLLIQRDDDDYRMIVYRDGKFNYLLYITSDEAFGESIDDALTAGFIVRGSATRSEKVVDYTTISSLIIEHAELEGDGGK